jgi:hypothetical protein
MGERYDRITGTTTASRLLSSFKPKLRKFVAPNQQSIELNAQERILLKQVAKLFTGSGAPERDNSNEVLFVSLDFK